VHRTTLASVIVVITYFRHILLHSNLRDGTLLAPVHTHVCAHCASCHVWWLNVCIVYRTAASLWTWRPCCLPDMCVPRGTVTRRPVSEHDKYQNAIFHAFVTLVEITFSNLLNSSDTYSILMWSHSRYESNWNWALRRWCKSGSGCAWIEFNNI